MRRRGARTIGAICERDSSGTTEARSETSAKVMERIARREPPKAAKRLAQKNNKKYMNTIILHITISYRLFEENDKKQLL